MYIHVYYLVVPLGGSCRSAPAGAVRFAGRGSLVQDSPGHLPTKFSCTLDFSGRKLSKTAVNLHERGLQHSLQLCPEISVDDLH